MAEPFDCSELFPHYEKADCVVIENSARIRLWQGGTHSHIDMEVDKISMFLERCRSRQAFETPGHQVRHLA